MLKNQQHVHFLTTIIVKPNRSRTKASSVPPFPHFCSIKLNEHLKCFQVIYTAWFSWEKIRKHRCLNILWEGWITRHSIWSWTASALVARDNDHRSWVLWWLYSVLWSLWCQLVSFTGPDGHFYICLLKCFTINFYLVYITPSKYCPVFSF